MLTEEEIGEMRRVKYSCPIIESDEEVSVEEQWKRRRIRYRPCPVKLAEMYECDIAQTQEALQRFTKLGDGKYMTSEDLENFMFVAIDVCRGAEEIWTDRRTTQGTVELDTEGDIWSL